MTREMDTYKRALSRVLCVYKSIDELRARINEYIHFYNTERYQWTLSSTLKLIGLLFSTYQVLTFQW
ncbi:IS3 family transposase [Paenibacillus dendritiformis]|uniref:IS3 family transposase n=1 Tax=Paenibacillus dendritiformis TaxID=130049 RepID=UPI00365231B8